LGSLNNDICSVLNFGSGLTISHSQIVIHWWFGVEPLEVWGL
jgi:hypothetical protein